MAKRIAKPGLTRTLIILAALFIVMYALILTNVINKFYFITIVTIFVNIILAVSLNLITGFTGQFSLGHAGFMSIGAYVCAIITLRIPTHWGFILGVFAGAVCAALVGVAVGLPTLRLNGDYLAIATLGMSEIIRIVFTNLNITNGAAGLSNIPQFVNWPYLFVFTAGTVWIIHNFLHSTHGRACISMREDEIAAEATGISATKYKVVAFTIGAFFAGIAGALYASYFNFIKPETFNFNKSIDILVIVVLGGMGSLSGSVIAAIILAFISTLLQNVGEVRMIVYALMLVIIMIFRPQGLMGDREMSMDLLRKIKLPKFLSKKEGK